ncbi:MAG: hypothetical protein NC184_06800 [Roseburia sp.]|nr:hypothetical protein [Roseburia sp.]
MPKLLINDTVFEFSVEQYEQPDVSKNYKWSRIRLGVKNNYMDYCDCNEMLTIYEVSEIIAKLDDLLNDEIVEEEALCFIEPDITMRLYPAHINLPDKRHSYVSGHSASECLLDITLHFIGSQGVYVGENWTITLDRNKIIELLNGIKIECGRKEDVHEYVGLVGVSFIGQWADIYWYRYDGNRLWSQQFVKVGYGGKEEYAMVEYARMCDTAHLPCRLDELSYIVAIVDDSESGELLDKWREVGYMDADQHVLRMVLSDGTIFTIEKKTDSQYRIAVRNEYINYEKTTEMFGIEDRQDIADYLDMLLNGGMREVTAVRTADSNLAFMFCPRGAKVVDKWCEYINPTDFHGNRIDERFAESTMKIDVDLCGDGLCGRRYFSMYLFANETEQFATQWATKILGR